MAAACTNSWPGGKPCRPVMSRPALRNSQGIWRGADKIVYSTTLRTASTPGTSIEHWFEPEAVRQMKASAGQDLAVGGPTLAAHAFKAGLVAFAICSLRRTLWVVAGASSPATSVWSWSSRRNVAFATAWGTYTTEQPEAKSPSSC